MSLAPTVNCNNLLAGALARGVALGLFVLAFAPLILVTPAHAADDNTVSITVDPAAQLTQQGDFYKATTNVKVKTGKPYGFDLTMKADGNGDLVNTVDPSHRISNMQGDSGYRGIEGIPANSWGYYMYDWHHNITVRPVYGHVPAAKDSERTLLSVTAAEQKGCSTNHSNCSKDVTFAANIDPAKLASGSYGTAITYTATAKPKPKLVDWDQREVSRKAGQVCRSGDTSSSCLVDLDRNMIPVKYTGNIYKAEWTSVANPEDEDAEGDWYDYVNKQWANAITVKPDALKKYKGQTKVVDKADILGFWVYIPRYRYKVLRFSPKDPAVSAQNFEIEFENKDSTKAIPIATGTWATHPAFTFGSKELNGIWFAKFETTGTNTQPTVLPNEAHMSGNYTYTASSNIGRMYNTAKTLGVADSRNVGGNTDYSAPTQNNHHLAKLSSHMVNNNDWGAATYLSASKYGAGYNGVRINPENYNTGHNYNTSDGQLTSTTNNPTGIYDMAGGGWEYVAASYTSDLNSSSTNYFDSAAHPPYVNTYNFSDPNSCTFATCGGQALYETNNGNNNTTAQWNGNWMHFVESSYQWFARGGYYGHGSLAGLFCAGNSSGYAYSSSAFRVALAPLQD